MSTHPCNQPITFGRLAEYWLNELDTEVESAIEEHLLGCCACSGRLKTLVELVDGVKRIMRAGRIGAILTGGFVQRLKQSGVRVREYKLEPSERVYCTITPEDDLVVAHIHAPLHGIERLDVRFQDLAQDTPMRLANVPFNADSGELVFAPDTGSLRRLERSTQRLELIAVEKSGERVVASYTFNHSPYQA